jgi:hypothetical protein
MAERMGRVVYFVRRMNLVFMWHGKAIVLVENDCLNVYVFSILRALLPWKCFGQRNWQVIECRNCMLRKTECRVSEQPEDVQRPRDVHRKVYKIAV